jgi:hypothetical protein
MRPDPTQAAPPRGLSRLLVFVLTYAVSRVLLAAAGASYNPFSEPFSARRLAVDFGAWAAVYLLVWWLAARWAGTRRPAAPSHPAV